ncbi:MAG: hypothetical protein JO044_17470 [Mycobacteriaceae bacterium]|nr:hypothetical protein [Mycobacteriaceae bacterium]
MNTTHYPKKGLISSAFGATVAAAAVPALVWFAAGPAQAAPAPLTPIHSLPLDPAVDAQVAAADQQLSQAEADYKNASAAQDYIHSTLTGWQNQLGPANNDLAAKQQALKNAQGHLSEEKMIPGPETCDPGATDTFGCGTTNNVDVAQQKVTQAIKDVQNAQARIDQVNMEISNWQTAANNADAQYTKAAQALSQIAGQDAALHQQQGTPPPK